MESLVKEMREKYFTARKLIDKQNKEHKGYGLIMKAQTILMEMRYKLSGILMKANLDPSFFNKILGMLVVIAYDLGTIALDFNDLKKAFTCFHEVLVLIPDKTSRPTPNFVLFSIKTRNVFGAEYIEINPKVAARMVDEAEKIYLNYRKCFPKKEPYSPLDHFEEKVKFRGGSELIEAHSLTKFYLRQYSRPVSYFYKSLTDCYDVLRMMVTTKITDLSAPAEIAIILGEYFINEREFHYGRYLLCIAAYIIDKYQEYVNELEAKKEAMKIQKKKEGAETSEEPKEGEQDKGISVVADKKKNEVEPSLGENEILAEVEEIKKEGEIFVGEDEILVEIEERKEETDSSDDVDEEEQYVEVVDDERKRMRSTSEEMIMREQRGTWIEYEEPTVEEEINGWRAFLARAWVKYGLHLMKYASQSIAEPRVEFRKNIPQYPKIPNLDLHLYENQITDEYPKTLDEATPVFLFTQCKLIHAKSYYSLFLYPHEHVALAQEHSLLIRYIMKYEDDGDELKKYLKARVRMLEPLSLQLNYKHYLPSCRLLWFELGKCYHELLLIKFDSIDYLKDDNMHKFVERVNHYCCTGINHLHNYIDSFRDRESRLPDPIPPDAVVKFVFAHFYLGRMYHSYITYDDEEANEYTLMAFSCFRYVVRHCEKDETMMEALKDQYEILSALRVATYKNKLLLVRHYSSKQ